VLADDFALGSANLGVGRALAQMAALTLAAAAPSAVVLMVAAPGAMASTLALVVLVAAAAATAQTYGTHHVCSLFP